MNIKNTFTAIKERSWVIAMITFLLVIVILIVGYQTFKATEMATFDEFNQRQFIIAREATGAIELYIETLARAMKALSRVPGVVALMKSQPERYWLSKFVILNGWE